MIHNVRVVNYLGEEVVMELRNPERSGFLIYNMTGLGPEKAEIRTTDIVTADGGIYNSSRLPARNIVLSVRFFSWEGKTVEQIRHESYKHFPIKKPVTIFITTDERVGEIVGYVEANEPVIFSRETHMQLSIICPYPYFFDGGLYGDKVYSFGGVTPRFEFPFSNESLTEPLLIMGDILIYAEGTVVYNGDAEVGVTITIDALGPATNITMHKVDARESMSLNTTRLQQMTGKGIVAGDQIRISTVKGQKSITLLRGGVFTNILNILDRGADWFELTKGDNFFAFEAEQGIENLVFTIENRTLYEGV
jgi:Phage tail protein.